MHSSLRALATRRVLHPASLAALLLGCGAQPEAPSTPPLELRFDEMGGEAWTFARDVRGTVSAGCAEVELRRGPFALRAPVDDGRFAATVPLAPGVNTIEASCAEPETSAVAQTELRVRLPAAPRAIARVESIDHAITLAAEAEPNGGTDAPIAELRWSADPSNPAPLTTTKGTLAEARTPRIELAIPEEDGEYVVWVTARDRAGERDRAGVAFIVEGGEARALDRTHAPPTWMDEAVIYGVVPALFGEPAFDAVTARLPKLAELGVTTLWLSPIFDSPDGDYGYAVDDYFSVRDEWGTRERFRALVDRAHALGMKVVLDFVPNHTSAEHRYFQHAQAHGARSPYWDFYERDADGEPTHYFDWEHLPNLDYDNPEVRRWMIEAFSFWTRELDVDGFRVDVAWGVLERAPEFFGELREELVRIEPDVLLLAEASAQSLEPRGGPRDEPRSYHGFDAAYDWTTEVGHWAWRDVFSDGEADVDALAGALADAPEAPVFRFLDNNDTAARFLTRHGPGLDRVATAMLFTLPGIPGLFTGQAIGAAYEPYQQVEPLAFTPAPARFARFRALAEMRAREEALQTGRFVPLEVEGEDVYAFARLPGDDPAGGRPIVVVLGFGAEPTEARVRLTAEVAAALDGRRPEALLGDGRPTLDGRELRVQLDAHDPRVWAFE